MATTRHSSLVERGGRKAFVREKGLAQISLQTYISRPNDTQCPGRDAQIYQFTGRKQ